MVTHHAFYVRVCQRGTVSMKVRQNMGVDSKEGGVGEGARGGEGGDEEGKFVIH